MYRIILADEWVNDGSGNAMRVTLHYPGTWTDITGQLDVPTDPNLTVVEGEVSDDVATQIDSDLFYDGRVLLMEPING